MTSDGNGRGFDCVKWTREVRAQIYEETKDLSPEERRERSEAIVRRDPFYSRIPKYVPPKRAKKRQD